MNNLASGIGNKTTASTGTGSTLGLGTGTGTGSALGGATSGIGRTGLGGSTLGKGLGGGLGLGLGAQQQSLVTENKKISEIPEEAQQHIIQVKKLVEEYGTKIKPLEGAEAFDKRLTELEEDMKRAILHTLTALANEVDHGNIAISELRYDLELSQQDLNNAVLPHSSPSPFLIRFVDSIDKRSKNLKDAIDAFNNKSQLDTSIQSTRTLVSVLEEQDHAITRCSARVYQVNEKSNKLKNKVVATLRQRKIELRDTDEIEAKTTNVQTLKNSYEEFLADRKRNLEKHNLNEEQYNKPQAATGLGRGFGLGRGLGGLGRTTGLGGLGTGSGLSMNKTAATGGSTTNKPLSLTQPLGSTINK